MRSITETIYILSTIFITSSEIIEIIDSSYILIICFLISRKNILSCKLSSSRKSISTKERSENFELFLKKRSSHCNISTEWNSRITAQQCSITIDKCMNVFYFWFYIDISYILISSHITIPSIDIGDNSYFFSRRIKIIFYMNISISDNECLEIWI